MSKLQFEVGTPFMDGITSLKRADILDRLSSVAYREKEETYTRQLLPEEVSEARARLSESVIKLAEIQERKKEIMDEFKAQIKEEESVKQEFVSQVKHKSISVEGRIFEMDDQENGVMYKFDERGICIEVRGLLPQERQGRIRMMNTNKTGTEE